ncbi:MAG: Ig-like domain-containing protein [Gemmatimonadales bacterium]|nr:Ig-like domain-containing protein [Gemmatimonadales bacterium]
MAIASGDLQSDQVGSRLAPLRVIVTQAGAPVEGITVTWSATGGTVAPASTVTANGGFASVNWDLPQMAGTFLARASATEASNSPVTFTATAMPGPPATLIKGEGDGQSGPVNTILPTELEVKVVDAFGNPLEGLAVNWFVTTGTATLTPDQDQTDASGQATTEVQLGATPGVVTVTATPGVVVQGAPATFNLTATP